MTKVAEIVCLLLLLLFCALDINNICIFTWLSTKLAGYSCKRRGIEGAEPNFLLL